MPTITRALSNYMRRAFLAAPFEGEKGSGSGRENAVEFVRPMNSRFPSGRGT